MGFAYYVFSVISFLGAIQEQSSIHGASVPVLPSLATHMAYPLNINKIDSTLTIDSLPTTVERMYPENTNDGVIFMNANSTAKILNNYFKPPIIKTYFMGIEELLFDSCEIYCNGGRNTINGIRPEASIRCTSYNKKFESMENAKMSNDAQAVYGMEVPIRVTQKDNNDADYLLNAMPLIRKNGASVKMDAMKCIDHVVKTLSCNKGVVWATNTSTEVLCTEENGMIEYSKSQLDEMCKLMDNDGKPSRDIKPPMTNEPTGPVTQFQSVAKGSMFIDYVKIFSGLKY